MFSKFHKIFDSLTDRERQIFQGAILIFILSLLLNGINLFYKKTILAPIEGGSYREGLVGQPISINPLIARNNDIDQDLIALVFRGLIDLTEKYKITDNQKSWIIELKNDIFWSDGEPITGDDVVFTIETIQNPNTRSNLFSIWQGVRAEKLNEKEVKFTLKTPYAFFLENLKTLKIVPEHIFGAIPTDNLRISDYNFEPVSSGPYAFLNYIKRKDGFINQYRFTENKFFEGDKPLIKDLIFKFFPDYKEAIDAFNKKEIDGLGGISISDIDKIKIGHQIHEINIPRYYAIFFNPGINETLKNKEVREALELATDRDKIIEVALKKYGIPITGPIYPSLEGFLDNSSNSEFSLPKAKEILDKNKWELGKDGTLTKTIKRKKVKLEFEIIVPKIDFLTETIKIIAEDWSKIGVKLTPIILSPAEVTNEIVKTRNYQMIIFGNILKTTPDVFSFWHSSERFHPGLNLALYENKTVDSLLESIRKTHNQSVRIKSIQKLQKAINADRPAIFLFSPNYLYAGPKNLGGFNVKIMSKPSERFEEINKWYLKTARVFK